MVDLAVTEEAVTTHPEPVEGMAVIIQTVVTGMTVVMPTGPETEVVTATEMEMATGVMMVTVAVMAVMAAQPDSRH